MLLMVVPPTGHQLIMDTQPTPRVVSGISTLLFPTKTFYTLSPHMHNAYMPFYSFVIGQYTSASHTSFNVVHLSYPH